MPGLTDSYQLYARRMMSIMPARLSEALSME